MIWFRGQIIAADALHIDILDRTFEHGLGLFETLRTWEGHPTLLPRPLARHKTLNYWRKRIAYTQAVEEGADEVLCVTPDGLVWEGTRSNIFLIKGRRLLTPATDGPLLAGIMRRVVLDHAARLGLEVV